VTGKSRGGDAEGRDSTPRAPFPKARLRSAPSCTAIGKAGGSVVLRAVLNEDPDWCVSACRRS